MFKCKPHNIQFARLYFRQWKNRGYAVFCSMGKVVHIGKLIVSIAQWIGNAIELIEEMIKVCSERTEGEDEEELFGAEISQLLILLTLGDVECEEGVIKININCR